jgi:hypothetical protein
LGHGSFALKLGAVFVPMTGAAGLYFLSAFVMRVPFTDDLVKMIRRRLRL